MPKCFRRELPRSSVHCGEEFPVSTGQIDLVTGAFSFTGNSVAARLRASGIAIRTLTNHRRPEHPLATHVTAFAYSFDDPERLAEALRGVHTLYNTYWVRFDHGESTYRRAVANTQRLFRAAVEAGVRRVVLASIANPSLDSPLPHYRGKAELEQTVRESGLSYAIVRPTVIFGAGGLLVNNIAWLLRRQPFFAVIGSGDHRIQPVFVKNLAQLMIDAADAGQDLIMDAVGPETYRYLELARLLRERILATFSRRPPRRTAKYAVGATTSGLTAGIAALPERRAYGVPWSEGRESAALSTASLRDLVRNAG
jgi:NADH dehydrogenase